MCIPMTGCVGVWGCTERLVGRKKGKDLGETELDESSEIFRSPVNTTILFT